MQAVRVHAFGGVDALVVEEIPVPKPGPGQVLVRVEAAGVGPWDALIRSGNSVLPQPLPLIPGSDFSGVITSLGSNAPYKVGEEVFGVTNARFTDAYAEYAVVDCDKIALKPPNIGHIEAASLPVIACTADQMLFDHAHVTKGTKVLILGAAGNVGAIAVQLAHFAGAHATSIARATHHLYLQQLGADNLLTPEQTPEVQFDVVIDLVGGEPLRRSFEWIREGGILVSACENPDQELAKKYKVHASFMLVKVVTEELNHVGKLVLAGKLRARVGEVLPLTEARQAHEMMEGKRNHKPGKILLVPKREHQGQQ